MEGRRDSETVMGRCIVQGGDRGGNDAILQHQREEVAVVGVSV